MDAIENIRLWVIDVDGTMTDAGIYYDEQGNELKKFCTKDAAGFFAAHRAGMEIMVLTGRECEATKRRMKEMKVDYLCQDIKDKIGYLQEFVAKHGLTKEQIAYIGDDLNDLPAMKMAGFVGCPKDSCEEILVRADYVSRKKGGQGAVRDVIEHVLREQGRWEKLVGEIYGGI